MFSKVAGKPTSRQHGFIRRSTGLGIFIAVSLLASGTALADNVQNDILINGGDTITAGGSTAIGYRILATNGDGQNGCNAADTSPAVVTINKPTAVTVSPSTLSFTACSSFQDATFSAATAGNYLITVSVSDSGAGTYNTAPATFTLKVLAPSDSTPPVITSNVSGTLGNNGWYASDVGVSWSVNDPESAVSSSTGCDDVTISADTAGQTLTCSATSTGGTNSKSVTIKRDATAPTISGSAAPAPNSNGWNNGDVAVSFTCVDALSGLASCGPNVTLDAEGANQSATGTATDNAGNSTSATVGGINIDKTAPTVSLGGGPANGGTYYFGSVPVAPTCSASDDLSGLVGPCSVSGYGNSIGDHTVTAGAKDKAGNEASASASYSVAAWRLQGFFSPVDMGYLNTVKGGSTVPLKFRVFAGDTELTDTSAIANLSAAAAACPGSSMPVAPVEELAPAGGTVLRYDATGGQFIYNWKTTKNPGKCYKVTLTTQDGSKIIADFKLS